MTGPDEFYRGLDKDSDKLVTWKGELYFELHRGTYTNHGDVKRGNRLSEVLLHNLEVASSYAYYAMNNSYRVPQTELNRMWKMTLCNQFHDVLPGTCIELAYQEVFEYYNEIDQLGNRLLDDALRNIFYSNTKVNPETETLTDLGVLNTLSWTRNEVIKVPLNKFKRGQDLNFDQISHDGKVGYKAAVDLKPFTPSILKLTDHPQLDEKMSEKKALNGGESVSVFVDSTTNVFFLENSFIKARFSDRGQLISLYDKRVNRELIPEGSVAHQLQLFEDIPLDWDAWDVEVYHLEKYKNFTDATVNILEMGPVVASLEIKYNLTLGSSAVIVVSLSSLSPRLDFHAKVDWRENRRFLKVEFTFDIRNDHAHYETQWGNIKRPNHYNTSWDMAKFEVCGHRFCDLSEYGYGVAVVNDLKYGYACLDNKIRLSLLRSSKGPDGNSDMKVHEFQYGIYPHPNRFLASDAMQIAHEFSVPSVYLPISHQPNFSRSPLFQLRGDSNVFLETIKRSEDFDENLIVRLYEAYGGHARVRLMSPLPVSSIKEVSILEEEITADEMGATYSDDDLEWEAQGFVQLEFKPFEIKTLRLSMR
jgi:alpha-mannosidase